MIKSALIVGVGSFAGGVVRYGISCIMKNYAVGGFPWGTLAVNLTGCLLIGLIYGLFSKTVGASNSLLLFLTTGFCGGFTTFSTFANESLQMLQNGNIGSFIGYIAVSVIVGIALTLLGYQIAK